jgi:hypothetical protein
MSVQNGDWIGGTLVIALVVIGGLMATQKTASPAATPAATAAKSVSADTVAPSHVETPCERLLTMKPHAVYTWSDVLTVYGYNFPRYIQAMTDAVGQYRQSMSTIPEMAGYRTAVISALSIQYPDYDATTYNAKLACAENQFKER